MKKTTTLFACIMLMLGIQLKAQWLTTGNTLGGSEILGSNNNKDVHLVAFGSTVMTLQASSGNVGIGVAIPGYGLDVSSIINSGSGYFLGGSSMLSNNGVISNILIGPGAGASTSAADNIFIGYNAGLANTTVGGNTGIGSHTMQFNTTGAYNTGLGYKALYTNTTGYNNTALGYQALNSNMTGFQNTATGYYALYNNTASYNTANGAGALTNNTSGSSNTAVGSTALFSNTTGSHNTAVGVNALVLNTTGASNTAVGEFALDSNTTGTNNSALGYQALINNHVGGFNTAIGNVALSKNNGTYNTAVGSQALASNITGNNNTAVGVNALITNGSASNNCAFGYNALNTSNNSNNCAFGYQALKSTSGGSSNCAFGYQALVAATGGINNAFGSSALAANTTGSNHAFGFNALTANTTGNNNSAFGYTALATNVTGNSNVAFGDYALSANTANANSAFGYYALRINSSGVDNVAVGDNALSTNTSHHENTAVGYYALQASDATGNCAFGYQSLVANTTGTNNCGVGFAPLYLNTTGNNNTALGYLAGYNNTTADYNTFIGSGTDISPGSTFTNSSAIGHAAVFSASNIVQMGNSSLLGVYCATGVFTTSDVRFKKNVNENVKGLAFIKKLRPVTYNLDTKAMDDFLIQGMVDSIKTIHRQGLEFETSTNVVHSGFIAQEVAQAGSDVGFSSSIVSVPQDNNVQTYAVNYAEIVVPLVKAVQELSTTADSLKTVAHKQDSINHALQNQINQIVNNCCTSGSGTGNRIIQNNNSGTTDNKTIGIIEVQLSDADVVVLNQNQPNPFAEQTTISYNIPQNTNFAQILFYDITGRQIKAVDVTTKGKGQLNVYANDLTNGMYSYTLIVDGKIVDTKKMMKQQ